MRREGSFFVFFLLRSVNGWFLDNELVEILEWLKWEVWFGGLGYSLGGDSEGRFIVVVFGRCSIKKISIF